MCALQETRKKQDVLRELNLRQGFCIVGDNVTRK